MAADDADLAAAGGKKTCSQRWDDFMKWLYNKEKGEVIGRTASSWAKIGLFYLIYYSSLAGFFALMLTGFFTTISEDEPTQQGMYTPLKGNPGMGFRPMISVESTLIHFKTGTPKSYEDHLKSINELLDKYGNQTDAVECGEDYRPSKDKKEVCRFDLAKEFGVNCTKANDYGYKEGKPCILLKSNRVFGWQPEPFDNTSLADESDDHAMDAKRILGEDRMNPNYIGVTCEGENEGDVDNLFKAAFYPDLGYSYAYYPYYNHEGYLSPLVFVQLEVRKGALIQVWCKLWAKNIKHHKNDKAGSTHFELLVD